VAILRSLSYCLIACMHTYTLQHTHPNTCTHTHTHVCLLTYAHTNLTLKDEFGLLCHLADGGDDGMDVRDVKDVPEGELYTLHVPKSQVCPC
jgi:hypothetical protein